MINEMNRFISSTQATIYDTNSLTLLESMAKCIDKINECINDFNSLEIKTTNDYNNFLNKIIEYKEETNKILALYKKQTDDKINEFNDLIMSLGEIDSVVTLVQEQSKFVQDLAKENQDKIDKSTIATQDQIKELDKISSVFLRADKLGCDITGKNECSSILQKYIDDGFKILFPDGKYKCSLIPKSNTILKCENKGGATLILPTGQTNVIYTEKSSEKYEIEGFLIDGNNTAEKGIYLSNKGTLASQDLEPIVRDVKIINCKTGFQVDEGIRGGLFENINAGACDNGIKHLSTDCIFNNCIACMNKYDGFFILKSNNTFNTCKAFCNGISNKYGSGIKLQGSFNRLINCESQQNVFEGLYLQNANNNLIIMTIDGSGWNSKTNFVDKTYPDGGNGSHVPISCFRSYNSSNNIGILTIINGRLDSYSKTAFYCQYSEADKNNNFTLSTYNDGSEQFTEYVIDYPDNYWKNNKVVINSKEYKNKQYKTVTVIDNQVEIQEGGYIEYNDMIFVNIKLKSLVTQNYGNQILSGFPRSKYALALSCSFNGKATSMSNDGKISIGDNLNTNEVFRITGMYIKE